MRRFGIKLTEVNNIEMVYLGKKYSNNDRKKHALDIFKGINNKDLNDLIVKFGKIFMAAEFDIGHTKQVVHEIKVLVIHGDNRCI